jgi:hypothetical protein
MKSNINLLFCIIISCLLCSCAKDNFFFKRSASNKLVDRKGFEGSKRRPLYNNKYIEVAKKNIESNDYEEKEDYDLSEEKDPPSDSIHMYQKMMEMEKKRILANMKKSRESSQKDSPYPVLSKIKPKSEAESAQIEKESEDLRRQIEEMRGLVNEMKKQISGSKCGIKNPSITNNAPVNLCPAPVNDKFFQGSTDQKMCYPK